MSGGAGRIVGLAFCAAALAATVFAFSPRPLREFPATGLRPDTLLLLDADRAGGRIVVVGERGRILLSDDEGESWRATASPTEATLTAVRFVDADHGWAVGHDGVILRSADGGTSWILAHSAPEREQPLFAVHFRDRRHGIAVGAYGAYLETTDGGRSWSARGILRDDRHLNAIAEAGGGRLALAGEAGALLISSDAGASWTMLPSPYRGSLFGIIADGAERLLAFGLRGNVLRSADAGREWRRVEGTGEATLMGGRVLAPGQMALVGHDAAVLLSRDGGLTFALHHQRAGGAFSAVVRAADGSLLAFGERGVTRVRGFSAP
jgi:photosystem II stability/assembly factor-like uncharacterized protein